MDSMRTLGNVASLNSYGISFCRTLRELTLRCASVVSTGRPSLSQVMPGGGMPLEMHSRLMDLWRMTERSEGPVLRIDGGTRKKKKRRRTVLKKKTNTLESFEKERKGAKRERTVFTQSGQVHVACIYKP